MMRRLLVVLFFVSHAVTARAADEDLQLGSPQTLGPASRVSVVRTAGGFSAYWIGANGGIMEASFDPTGRLLWPASFMEHGGRASSVAAVSVGTQQIVVWCVGDENSAILRVQKGTAYDYWYEPKRIYGAVDEGCRDVAVARNGDQILVTWTGWIYAGEYVGRVMSMRLSLNGSPLENARTILTRDSAQLDVSAKADGDGFVVISRDHGDIEAVRISPEGNVTQRIRDYHNEPQIRAFVTAGPIAFLPVVAYEYGRKLRIAELRFDDGTSSDGSFRTALGGSGAVGLGGSGTGGVLVWVANDGLRLVDWRPGFAPEIPEYVGTLADRSQAVDSLEVVSDGSTGLVVGIVGGTAIAWPISRGDGVDDAIDNCPESPNADQADVDGDGIGDACDDEDRDGVPAGRDNCLTIENASQSDIDGDTLGDPCDPDLDGDGVWNHADTCPELPNAGDRDVDGDGAGNACDDFDDRDPDADGIPNSLDNCYRHANPDQLNLDGDRYGDACDGDDDADGRWDIDDNCPMLANTSQEDRDNDGIGDACDDAMPTPERCNVTSAEPQAPPAVLLIAGALATLLRRRRY